MQNRPTSAELLAAVRDFLEREAAPHLGDARLRYHCLIAASVLRIVERDMAGEEARLRAELALLGALLDRPVAPAPSDLEALRQRVLAANRALCARIRAGEADQGAWRDGVLAHVRAAVREALAIDNPAELGGS
jgi:hypothetical protein